MVSFQATDISVGFLHSTGKPEYCLTPSSSNIGQYNDKILSKVNKVTFPKKVVKLLQGEKF